MKKRNSSIREYSNLVKVFLNVVSTLSNAYFMPIAIVTYSEYLKKNMLLLQFDLLYIIIWT